MKKNSKAYKTIGEVAEILELDSIGNKKNTHTIRYWETEFKQVKPIMINKRRHYDDKNIELLKRIKFLLKDKGMTINGVKRQLNINNSELDEIDNISINTKKILKSKLKKISKIVKELKNQYGQKNTC